MRTHSSSGGEDVRVDLEQAEPLKQQPQHVAPPQSHSNPSFIRGNLGPFGLLCFGMTTSFSMFIATGWSPPGFTPAAISYAMFYGGLGQLIVGILELIKGNTFAGSAVTSYGCYWMGWFFWKYMEVNRMVEPVSETALTGETLYLALWGLFSLGFFVITLRKNGCLQVIFGSLVIAFFLLAGGNYSEACRKAGGYVGFFCGASAIYAAFATLYKEELGWELPGLRETRYI